MDPMTLLAQQSPNLLQGIVSLFDKPRDPLEELTRYLDEMQRRFGPQALMGGVNQLYGNMLSSPFGRAGMSNIMSGAQRSSNLLNRNLAAAGIGGSGVGQIQRSLAPSVMGGAVNQFKGGLYGMSMDQMQQLLQGLMRQSQFPGMRQSPLSQLQRFAGAVGNTDWRWALDWWNKRKSQGGAPQGYPGQDARPKIIDPDKDWNDF